MMSVESGGLNNGEGNPSRKLETVVAVMAVLSIPFSLGLAVTLGAIDYAIYNLKGKNK